MQVTSDGPISDEESIDRAITKYLIGVQLAPDDYEGPRRVFETYNQNPRFVELAEAVYFYLKPPS